MAHDSVCRTLQSCDGMQFATGANLIKQEGFLALYSGLVPAVGRGLFYGKLSLAVITKRSLKFWYRTALWVCVQIHMNSLHIWH